jgi:septum site-determining protein MinD
MADIMDVAGGHVDLLEACKEHKRIKGLYYLTAPSYLGTIEVNLEALGSVFKEIRNQFDYCLLDTPAGIGDGFRMAHTYADMSIIVTTGELPAIRNAQKTAYASNVFGVKEKRLLINRVTKKDFKWLHQTIDDMINTIGIQLIGVIGEDKSIFKAVHTGDPLLLYKKKHAAYEFMDTALRLTGKDVPLRLYFNKFHFL